ncbi:uroporphyrinogen-III synthase [Paenibacillus sp. UNCCL117]|uniref:uroporphyrinogen-III synthase n=1 Tax=unclassified Paenibacillus TaxID=185978 RepID=UPI0008905C84|nr:MULTISPECIES: uroporphyrinogen-III synthase [unclassified Paenibacillus]SDB98707.1 uroporphyrinogen-III synthase [Paenibacillus sp. cl123]SFW68994.1 uroporphyrinogen-III synthase [Paenibacillus sp. UNCCL117]
MSRLHGKRVAITGPRKAAEMSAIVEKMGGIALVRPAQGTVAVEDELVQAEVKKLLVNGADWLLLTTGVGTELLVQAAEAIGEKEAFVHLLGQANVAARGYKTVNVLKKLGVHPAVRDDDGTTNGLIRAMEGCDLKGKKVALQLYGDHAPRLVQWLTEQGADYHEILPYRHIPPELAVADRLLDEIIGSELDAVTFTSTPQVRFLMQYARERGISDRVLQAFDRGVIAVAVGKVTAEALREEGVTRIIAPEEERMGSMMVSLAKYYEKEAGHLN